MIDELRRGAAAQGVVAPVVVGGSFVGVGVVVVGTSGVVVVGGAVVVTGGALVVGGAVVVVDELDGGANGNGTSVPDGVAERDGDRRRATVVGTTRLVGSATNGTVAGGAVVVVVVVDVLVELVVRIVYGAVVVERRLDDGLEE